MLIGKIVRLQVQLNSLKTGAKPFETYAPVPNLVAVEALRLTADGVEGVDAEGRRLADVHNRTHPNSKFRGDNGISIGFTQHYRAMRDRFGDHLTNGIAGENLLIECDEMVPLELIQRGTVITGNTHRTPIGPWGVAHPCAPFSKFCLQMPADQKADKRVTETLQFLENGTRGFVAVYDETSPSAEIRVGDVVYAIAD